MGSCGACWAFAATAALESHNTIRRKSLMPPSEQELVDYDSKSSGCQGGEASDASDYAFERVMLYDKFQPLQAVTHGPVVVPIAIGNNATSLEDYAYAAGLYLRPRRSDIDYEMLLIGCG
ncbi:hypothetical protein BRADI_4g42273v3 [Brachypodium distachyon]|uniref:Peptidase C1A papain C-terminal domain-containing protein n=1 Tax=Brachypodium distachyon TaxID=15368 RepID=A0A0Q3F0S7_BRADI|nr:hypothetical protein BRADI_4g42273v3 [Brachypodium distachyon]